MTKSIACAVGLFAVVAVAGVARAQTTQPVEWKVSEGGNGHWYQLAVSGPINWNEAKGRSETSGGHLATITSLMEDLFVASVANNISGWRFELGYGPWLGGFQDPSSSDYAEPTGGWKWVTGEQWSYAPWNQVGYEEPNNCYCNCGPENYLHYKNLNRNVPDRVWNDLNGTGTPPCPSPVSFVIEWDTDCNADGIVDYGQILRGELADDNHNSIPDVCETSVTGVLPPSVPSQGGVTITINGRNFPDNPTVLVGGTAATNVVRVSATRITATTPAGLPGMTSISVNGFTLPDAFYYRPECGSDLDQNGEVDTADISIILLDFGPCYQAPVAAPTKGPLPPALPDAPTPTSDAPQTR
jgi:hypothetical protein